MGAIYAKGQFMSNAAILRIASRGSPLALAQARLAREALADAHGWDIAALDTLCPIVPVKTTGDRIQDRPLAEAGGKGLFTKEIEETLIAGSADIAVHSMKDVPSALPPGLEIAAVLPREDPRDVFIARDGSTFADLKPGSRIGTSSVRRRAQVLRARPDLNVVLLRGNVGTRLAKLEAGEVDATILARAGLERLGAAPAYEVLDGPNWLPALCQGIIGIEVRSNNIRACDLLAPLDDPKTSLGFANSGTRFALACERAFLGALDGSCRTPIAGSARAKGNAIHFEGEVLALDGRNFWRASRSGDNMTLDEAAELGRDAASEIRSLAGNELPVS
jgi:hydroxymethylbilane synthase